MHVLNLTRAFDVIKLPEAKPDAGSTASVCIGVEKKVTSQTHLGSMTPSPAQTGKTERASIKVIIQRE